MTATTGTPERADAARNRARVVEAARGVFAERGLDVPMAEIAERAGVGVGTLYRRFGCREDLVAAIFAADMAGYADAAEEALAGPDPWHSLSALLRSTCQWQATDRGFSDILITAVVQVPQVEVERERAYRAVTALVDRAKAAGQVRADLTAEDIHLLLLANANLVAATYQIAPDAWRRLTALLISSFRAGNGDPAPPPPSAAALYQLMRRGLARDAGTPAESPRNCPRS
jgi:AcrR family transcriptional regulator